MFLLRHWLGRVGYRMRVAAFGTDRAKTPDYWVRKITTQAIWLCSIGGAFVPFSLLCLTT